MKVLFIYPSIHPSYPLQIGALSAYVKQRGHQTRLFTFQLGGTAAVSPAVYRDLEKEIESFRPDLVAFSAYEMSFPVIKRVSQFIKKNWPQTEILVGGYYPTLAPDEVINFPPIDIVCRGEGERPLLALLEARERGDETTAIENLWFKKDGRIIKNPVGPLIEDLDELPFPDREMFDYQSRLDLEEPGQRNVKVMATRGCPYSCTYCSNKYFRSLYPNQQKYFRFRSPAKVIAELKQLKEKYRFDTVGFHDDNLTLNFDWLKEFAGLYKKEIAVPFYCATRAELCTDEILGLLKDAGCYLLLVGVESGDEKYRQQMMKRPMSDKIIIDAFRRARKKGLLTWSFAMVGLPFENRRMILKTLWLNWRCRPGFVMASIFYPLKGTELGDVCYQKGWVDLVKKERVASYAWESILNHPILSSGEIRLAKYLNSLTAIRSKFFWQILLARLRSLLVYHLRV